MAHEAMSVAAALGIKVLTDIWFLFIIILFIIILFIIILFIIILLIIILFIIIYYFLWFLWQIFVVTNASFCLNAFVEIWIFLFALSLFYFYASP